MDSITQDALADTIGTQAEVDAATGVLAGPHAHGLRDLPPGGGRRPPLPAPDPVRPSPRPPRRHRRRLGGVRPDRLRPRPRHRRASVADDLLGHLDPRLDLRRRTGGHPRLGHRQPDPPRPLPPDRLRGPDVHSPGGPGVRGVGAGRGGPGGGVEPRLRRRRGLELHALRHGGRGRRPVRGRRGQPEPHRGPRAATAGAAGRSGRHRRVDRMRRPPGHPPAVRARRSSGPCAPRGR